MFEQLARRFQLEPNEARRAFALGSILFGLTSSYTLVKTVRDAHFLTELPASDLPYVYLGVGVITTIVALFFTRLTRGRASGVTHQRGAFVRSAHGVRAAPESRRGVGASQPSLGQRLGCPRSAFGRSRTVANPREASERSAHGVGDILGGLAGGAVAAPLAQRLTLPSLLTVAAILQALVGLVTFFSVRKMPIVSAESVVEDTGTSPPPLKLRYVRLLALAALCSVIVTGLLDFQFKVEIQRRIRRPASWRRSSACSMTNRRAHAAVVNALADPAHGAGRRRPCSDRAAARRRDDRGTGLPRRPERMWDQVARVSANPRTSCSTFRCRRNPAAARVDQAGVRRIDAIAAVILGAAATVRHRNAHALYVVAGLIGVWVVAWLGVRMDRHELGRNLRQLNLDTAVAVSCAGGLLKRWCGCSTSPYSASWSAGSACSKTTRPTNWSSSTPR